MNLERLSELDPQNFSLEDVIAIFGMWRWFAKLVMNTGVRRGEFTLLENGKYRHNSTAREIKS